VNNIPYVLSDWKALYPGVDRAIGTAEQSFWEFSPPIPCPKQNVNLLRVHLRHPQIAFTSTPVDGLSQSGVICSDFLTSSLQAGMTAMLATNANYFDLSGGDCRILNGLAISGGNVVSPASSSIAPFCGPRSLLITEYNQASFRTFPTSGGPPYPAWTAVSGCPELLRSGEITAPPPNSQSSSEFAARTAVGLSYGTDLSAEYLYLMTIDGRDTSGNGSYYWGATFVDAAVWLKLAGATDAINLDGGGSTTMARIDASLAAPVALSVPFDSDQIGSERPVGNCFGVVVNSR
jgi:hypothetical protein